MTIRTKLLVNIILLVSSLAIIGLVFNIVGGKVKESVVTAATADRILIGVSDMNTITYDYLMKPGERAREQWELKHAGLYDLIRSASFAEREESAILSRITQSHKDTELFFRQIVENSEKKKRSSASVRQLLDENNERNVTQLMARSQVIATDAYLLSRESIASIQKSLIWSGWTITITLFIVISISGLISYLLSRNITASIKTLKKGTEIIAGGDLDYRVPVKGRDEIASLSLSFNEMAGRLREANASVRVAQEALQKSYDELEQRVEERTAELRESEAKYRDLFENITEEVHFWELIRDADGRIVNWRLVDANPPTLATWGKKLEEIKGKTTDEIFGPGASEHYMPIVVKIITEGVPYSFEDYFPNLDRYFQFTSIPIGDHFITTGFDITNIKKAQMLAEERQVKLEVANKELESFSYSVSHDLRAPLRAIDGFSFRLLRDCGDKLDEEGRRKLRTVSKNAQQMGKLIDDLLSFSRLSRKEMHMSKINMGAMAAEVWKEIEEQNPERAIKFRVAKMAPAFGDPSLVRQVFANLLGNASKFTKEKSPAVVETGSSNDGSEIVYYVKDNGVGFDMRYYDKLFGVFERLHRTDEYEGTGVGLAIVQRIIRRHGGRVWADGKVNEGAVFYFTLSGKEKSLD